MGLFSFTANKVKSRIRESIYRSQDAIERIEADILQFKNRLAECENDPRIEQWAVDQLRGYIAAMEENLAEFRVNHTRFMAEQRKPSPAFPQGIAA